MRLPLDVDKLTFLRKEVAELDWSSFAGDLRQLSIKQSNVGLSGDCALVVSPLPLSLEGGGKVQVGDGDASDPLPHLLREVTGDGEPPSLRQEIDPTVVTGLIDEALIDRPLVA